MLEMLDWMERARQLHRSALVLDGHADTPQRFTDDGWHWSGDALGTGQISAETAREGGLDGEFFAAWAEPAAWHGRFAERTLQLIESVHRECARAPEKLALCTTALDVRLARQQGRFAALLGVEGGHSIENDLDLLRTFFRRGVRYMTLTWANANDWCDSSGEPRRHGGLTAFGREVVREMNRLGMLVDVSHVSDEAFWQVLQTSSVPVIASHSSARALTNSPRNLTDEMALALAAKGGLIMVNFYPGFVDESWRAAWADQREEREAAVEKLRQTSEGPLPFSAVLQLEREFAARIPRPLTAALVDHFDHLLRLVGPEHVGIGTDFDGIPVAPRGIDSAGDLPAVTAALLQRGWSEHAMRCVLGENLLGVLDEAARAAEKVATTS